MEEMLDLRSCEIEREPEPIASSLALLQAVYRSPDQPLPVRIRCAVAALPFEHPKLSVVGFADDKDGFAARLDAAIRRSREGVQKMIDVTPQAATPAEPLVPASDMAKPFARLRR